MAVGAFDLSRKSAVAMSKITPPGAGVANSACQRSDSAREIVLANT